MARGNLQARLHTGPRGGITTCCVSTTVSRMQSVTMQELMKETYGMTDLELIACDPWSIHVAAPAEYEPLRWRETDKKNGQQNGATGTTNGHTEQNGADALPPPRLVQTWLYRYARLACNLTVSYTQDLLCCAASWKLRPPLYRYRAICCQAQWQLCLPV